MASRLGLARVYSAGGLAAAFSATVFSCQPGVAWAEKDIYLDPDAWERAAKALRDINSQSNSKKVCTWRGGREFA